MKIFKNAIVLLFLGLPFFMQAQDANTETNLHKNEIGVDIVGLTKLLLDFNNTNSNTYDAQYQVTYKRHFTNSRFRFGIGGRSLVRNRDIVGLESEKLRNSNYDFRYRLGIEKSSKISKHWEVYYGADLRHDILTRRNDSYNNNGIINILKVKTNTVGIAPLVGFSYVINNRISLQTEASFAIFGRITKEENEYRVVKGNPFKPDDFSSSFNDFGTNFYAPNFLVLAIRL